METPPVSSSLDAPSLPPPATSSLRLFPPAVDFMIVCVAAGFLCAVFLRVLGLENRIETLEQAFSLSMLPQNIVSPSFPEEETDTVEEKVAEARGLDRIPEEAPEENAAEKLDSTPEEDSEEEPPR